MICYARASSNYSDFLKCHLYLKNRLLNQGYKKNRLIRSLKKFIFRYQDLVEIYSVSAETIINDGFSYSENGLHDISDHDKLGLHKLGPLQTRTTLYRLICMKILTEQVRYVTNFFMYLMPFLCDLFQLSIPKLRHWLDVLIFFLKIYRSQTDYTCWQVVMKRLDFDIIFMDFCLN